MMLELHKISKTYRPRTGAPVQALREVSLTFPTCGLHFIMGRSGSGKSTLLNLIGGLDRADRGEIRLDGVSVRDFRKQDYDRYRNHAVGFVFQEYNLLPSLTVGENIALALQLQRKEDADSAVQRVLHTVGLDDFADRRISELSGGQAQRVAIARALIKNPRIVLADEPTDALDRVTGDEVLTLLKELSRDRLILVVSHDRELAERYADRVIELQEGRVVADRGLSVSSHASDAEDANCGAGERSQVADLLGDAGKQRGLSCRNAVRIGLRGMRAKPIRLAITVILCLISFVLVGISDMIVSQDYDRVMTHKIAEQSISIAVTDGFGATESSLTRLQQDTSLAFAGVVSETDRTMRLPIVYPRYVNGDTGQASYYNNTIYGYLPSQVLDEQKFRFVAGRAAQNVDEIVLTQYTYEHFALGGMVITDGGESLYLEPQDLSTPQQFLERAILQIFDGEQVIRTWKIVGIVDTAADVGQRYAQLKPKAETTLSEEQYNLLRMECNEYFHYSYHSIGYISADAYSAILAQRVSDNTAGAAAKGSCTFVQDEQTRATYRFEIVQDDAFLAQMPIEWADGMVRDRLQPNEFVVGQDVLRMIVEQCFPYMQYYYRSSYLDGWVRLGASYGSEEALQTVSRIIGACEYAEQADDTQLQAFRAWIESLADFEGIEDPATVRALALYGCYQGISAYLTGEYITDFRAQDFTEEQWKLLYAGYLMTETLDFTGMRDSVDGGFVHNVAPQSKSGQQLMQECQQRLYVQNVLTQLKNKSFDSCEYRLDYDVAQGTYTIDTPKIVGVYLDSADNTDVFIMQNAIYSAAQKAQDPQFDFLIAPMPQQQATSVLHDLIKSDTFVLHDPIVFAVQSKMSVLQNLQTAFRYIGWAGAAFAVVLLGYFTVVSVLSQKREVGILSAMGASTGDVYRVFSVESWVLFAVLWLGSIVSTVGSAFALNPNMMRDIGIPIACVQFGLRQVGILLALGIGSLLLATLVVLVYFGKRKPIDCIRTD